MPKTDVAHPVILARYSTPEGGRVLIGRRLEGEVHVHDAPDRRPGRTYFAEACFASKAESALFVADYRRQAERLGGCPMCPTAIAAIFTPPLAEPRPPQVRTS